MLKSSKNVPSKTMSEEVQSQTTPASCSVFFWLPWLTNPNQNTEQSARSATHAQKRG